MLQSDFHPLEIGQMVSIFGASALGRPFCEGEALIDAISDRPHYYSVRFRGERASRLRFVNPDWQQDPARSLALLTEFWLASLAPPAIDEFFPSNRVGRGGFHGLRSISHAPY